MKKGSLIKSSLLAVVVAVLVYANPIQAEENSRTPYNGRCLKKLTFAPIKAEIGLELGNKVKCKKSESGTCSPGKCED